MSERHLSFSRAVLNKLPLPEPGKRVYYYDLKTPGLALGVTPKGTKTFVVYRKIQGRPERITLGRYPELSIDEARALAHETNAAVARGGNPNAAKRARRAEAPLADFFQEYLDYHAIPQKRSWREDRAQFQRYLAKAWGHRPLSSFTPHDVNLLHKQIGAEHGHYAANRLLSLLHTLFERAVEWGRLSANPATGVRRFKEKSRERFLQADELPRFFKAVAAEPNTAMRDYFMLSLLTGARKSNVLAMRWRDISFQRAEWRIPDTKNGTPQTVPLLPETLQILEQRQVLSGKHEFVFPSHSRSGHITEPKTAWKRVLKRAGIEDLRLHDLRRSLGSWQAATGANLSVIGKTLNHKDMKSTAVYARLDLDPVREAMQAAVKAMFIAGGGYDGRGAEIQQD